MSLSTEPVSLAEVLSESRAMMEPQAAQRGITMTFPELDAPWFVNADRTRVKQVLINLLSNAIKYNRDRGTVEVTCSAAADGRTRIGIKDTGTGLPPEKITQLFQPFNRLGRESGAEEGTGIGLVMSKRLVELMEGVIGVDSAVGMGSVFWFELMTTEAPTYADKGELPTPAVREKVRAPGERTRTVLYVEDNPANMRLVEQLIARRPDLALIGAVTGPDGVALARARLPDVILMDINLPGLSGIEAMKILREDPATAHIPVLALSANAMPLDIKKGLDAGFFGYLTKPIKVAEFMEALDLAIEAAAQRKS